MSRVLRSSGAEKNIPRRRSKTKFRICSDFPRRIGRRLMSWSRCIRCRRSLCPSGRRDSAQWPIVSHQAACCLPWSEVATTVIGSTGTVLPIEAISRAECAAFEASGLVLERWEDFHDDDDPPNRRFRSRYRRPLVWPDRGSRTHEIRIQGRIGRSGARRSWRPTRS